MKSKMFAGMLSALLVAAGAPAFAANDLASNPKVADALQLLDHWITEEVGYWHLPGLSIGIVRDQDLVWSKGYGFRNVEQKIPATPETLYRLGSVSKLFTSTAILELRDAGKLGLDDPVAKYLPEFAKVKNPFAGSPPVTIRDLLTHTSGLPRDTDIPYWTTHDFPQRPALMASLADLTLLHPPGAVYHYSNLGMGLLGQVVAAVSGQPYGDYLREHIFTPLGMTHSTAAPDAEVLRDRAVSYFRRMPDGSRPIFPYYDLNALAGAGNVISSVDDLARFAELQFRAGAGYPAQGDQILSGYTLAEMHRAQFLYPSFSGGRGLGFAVWKDGDDSFVGHGGWVGGNRTEFLLDLGPKLAVVVEINADDGDPYFFARRAYDLVAPAIAEATAVVQPTPVPDPAWQRYVGMYTDPWGWDYEVMILGGQLVMYDHNYPPEEDPEAALSRLKPTGPASFLLSDGEPLVFETDAQGNVIRIRRRYEYLTPKR